jgi:alkylation response protein AidB-like acyl-CoA dehydrogenase
MNATAQHESESLDPEELRDAARRFLADKVDRRAAWGETGTADILALEAEITAMGWPLLTIPAAFGGLDQSFLTLVPIYEETGRSLSPVSIADTMSAVDVLVQTDDVVVCEVLERLVGGKARLVTAFAPDLDGPTLNFRLSGIQRATGATDLVLLPKSGAGRVLLVDLLGNGVRIERIETWDRGRVFDDVSLTNVQGRELSIDAREAGQTARAHSDLALAWDSIGAAEQALTEAVAYMGTRQQFGRPVGSFQALKHRAADLKVGLELARAIARRASEVYAVRSTGWEDLAGQARLLAVDAYRAIAEESVQFHGGIGFTWEHDCHLFLKRALMNEMSGETQDQVRDRVAPGILARALGARGR